MPKTECWLTRQSNGEYILTAARPKMAEVHGAGHADAYVRYGDPIGLRHMCRSGTKMIFGVELEPLESVRVFVEAGRIVESEAEDGNAGERVGEGGAAGTGDDPGGADL